MKSILMCTFTHGLDVEIMASYIYENYTLDRGSIFVFENSDDPDEILCTYNASNVGHFMENTISIHRKKETNTLYTINALNNIIMGINDGVLDKSIVIEWELYTNSLLLTADRAIRVVPLTLKTVIRK